jgi:predicted hydrocarbon binding protein
VSAPTAAACISNRFIQLFVTLATEEIGAQELPLVLVEAELKPAAIEKAALVRLNGLQAAELYAALQRALRDYYGRGARGALLRIGRKMWDRMIAEANLVEKAELEIIRWLPVPARRRRVLDLLAEHLREGGGSASVHLLDIDLLLVHPSSATASLQPSGKAGCFVTLGMIQRALAWATGQEADVEEIACKAAGAPACEFKITFGGK